MGGFGSTRWNWISTKHTVESTRSLDINRLNRAGCLRPGYGGDCQWMRDGKPIASIQLRCDSDLLRLLYRRRQRRRDWQDIEQSTSVIWTPCQFGGARPYFVCPGIINGIACGRRVTKLYGAATISYAGIVTDWSMPRSAKIATTAHYVMPTRFACSSAESRVGRPRCPIGQRACMSGLTSVFGRKYWTLKC